MSPKWDREGAGGEGPWAADLHRRCRDSRIAAKRRPERSEGYLPSRKLTLLFPAFPCPFAPAVLRPECLPGPLRQHGQRMAAIMSADILAEVVQHGFGEAVAIAEIIEHA